jgi:anti-sigma factor RsiW
MKCSKVTKLISRYIDSDLSPDEKEAVTLHVLDCSACRKQLEETQALHALFASAEKFAAPYGFSTRVMARLGERESSRLWSFLTFHRSFLRAAEVSFALIVVMVGIISGNVLVTDRTYERQAVQVTLQESFSLDLFRAAPADSIGGAYARLMEANDER